MNKAITQEEIHDSGNTLARLKSGEFQHCYLIYNRKSTDEPENQKNSIKYQKAENIRFAYKEHLSVASLSIPGFCLDGIISEKHSGFKENNDLVFGDNGTVKYKIERPKFYQLVQLLSAGYFKGVIILCWDRASRNKGDDTVIRKLMKQGVDFRFTLASYDKTSSGALHMDIDGMFAEHHSRVTSEKVKINIRNRREQGFCTYKAPVGYLNPGSMENKPVDPIRGPIIARLYELYATGEWSLADLARFATEQGFTMQPARRRRTEEEKLADDEEDDIIHEIMPVSRPPTFNNIHKILTNRFYIGELVGNDGLFVKSRSHKPLVSVELFNKVQIELNKKKVSAHYLHRIDYPFRGIIRCANCNRGYSPYKQKGTIYYVCQCHSNCENTNRNFKIDFIVEKIGELVKALSFTDNEIADIVARASTDVTLLENKRNSSLEIYERKKKKIREDLSYLRSNKITLLNAGVYTPHTLIEEENNLNNKLSELQSEEQCSDLSMHETIKDTVKLLELLKTLYLHYEKANLQDKEIIVKNIFLELSISQNTLKYKCKNGFKALENRFIPVGDQTTWLLELQKSHFLIRQSIMDIESIHNGSP